MLAHRVRARLRFTSAIGLLVIAVACSDGDDPTAPTGLGRANASSQSEGTYPEERRAVELARTIPGLAGFYYDTSGNLVVLIKNLGNSGVIRGLVRPRFQTEIVRARVRNARADIVVRNAKYSFLELKTWRDQLRDGEILSLPGVVWLDLDEVQNRVVIGLDQTTDPVTVRAAAQSLDVPAEAIELERTAPFINQSTLRDEFRPIRGATQIQRLSGSTRLSCTLGFTALWNNQQVFLTAGHCSPNATGTDGIQQFQPIAPLTHADSATTTAIGREIFQFSEPCGTRRCSYSDAAIYSVIPDTIPPIPSQMWVLGKVARPIYGCSQGPCNPPQLNVTANPWVIDTTRGSFVVNDLVSEIGSATGWSQGWVQRTCVDVSPSKGVTYRCQMFANYGSGDGDSGAPILLDIGGAASATVTLGGIHSGRSGSNAVFSPWSGIVRDYGSLTVVAPPQDTTHPPMPGLLNLPQDSTFTVELPGIPRADALYYRNIVGIIFDDSTSGTTIRRLLTNYGGSIIGGVPGAAEYIVQLPDPGPTFEAVDSIVTGLNAEPGVKLAREVYHRWKPVLDSRYPLDGPDVQKANWAVPTNATRPLLQIRAPLAWGCETGAYSTSRVRVGVIDIMFDSLNPDLSGRPWVYPAPSSPPTPNQTLQSDPGVRGHGTAVAGVLAAHANNGIDLAGMLWASDLTTYSLTRDQAFYPQDPIGPIDFQVDDAIAHHVRLITMSVGFGWPTNPNEVARIRLSFERFLRSGGLLVLSTGEAVAGQAGLRLTIPQLAQSQEYRLGATKPAAAQLYQGGYADQIIWVAGTDNAGAFWPQSHFWSGGTVVAPATNIATLENTADGHSTGLREGTSFSAPYVAGVAGLLWSMDSTLSAAQVKDYILRGARQPRVNRQTGQITLPLPVSGAPETVYQLDAYGALTLLARERRGISLCGNRAWVSNQTVYAERDTASHGTEQLVALAETAAYVNVLHGGRRFELYAQSGFRAFALQQGQWVETQDTATTPYGGAYLSLLQYSHDLDSTVGITPRPGDGFVDLDVNITQFSPRTTTRIQTIHVLLPSSGPYMCFHAAPISECPSGDSIFTGTSTDADWRVAYSPQGDRVFVAVTYLVTRTMSTSYSTCPWPPGGDQSCLTASYRTTTDHTDVHEISLPTGSDAVLWPVPGRQVYWAAGSEDGAQVVGGEGQMSQDLVIEPYPDRPGWRFNSQPQIVTGCSIVYRIAAPSGTQLHSVPSDDSCRGNQGQGTMSPIRMSSR